MHQGLRCTEMRRVRKQNTDYAKQHHTPHCWLAAKVMCPAKTQPSVSLGKLVQFQLVLLKNIQIYITHFNLFPKDDIVQPWSRSFIPYLLLLYNTRLWGAISDFVTCRSGVSNIQPADGNRRAKGFSVALDTIFNKLKPSNVFLACSTRHIRN